SSAQPETQQPGECRAGSSGLAEGFALWYLSSERREIEHGWKLRPSHRSYHEGACPKLRLQLHACLRSKLTQQPDTWLQPVESRRWDLPGRAEGHYWRAWYQWNR